MQYPGKMSEAKRAKTVPRRSAFERKSIFDRVYLELGVPLLDAEDELFKKDSSELSKSDSEKYSLYFSALKQVESNAERKAAEELFFSMAGKDQFSYSLLKKVCNELGPLLFDIADTEKELTDKKRLEIAEKIQKILVNDFEHCKMLLECLSLDKFVNRFTIIPASSKGIPYSPSSMKGHLQVTNSGNERSDCFVYPYPFCIAHFPVFFCHPMFSDFMDILHGRNPNNPVVKKYQEFVKEMLPLRELDECIASLISVVLESNLLKKEKEFVSDVAKALQQLFPRDSVQTNFRRLKVWLFCPWVHFCVQCLQE